MIGPNSTEIDIKVGSRITCNNQIGTVKYVGEVEGYQDIWLGIDWDDPNRGKHDGVVNNQRYFNTRYPTSGSLVRPNKVSIGVDILMAIKARYSLASDNGFVIDQNLINQCKKVLKSTSFEVVGMNQIAEKQSNLNELSYICLEGENVSRNSELLRDSCPNVIELVLSHNLLSDWVTVAEIVNSLPRLENVQLSKNIMSIPDNPLELSGHFKNVRNMILSSCYLSFPDILQLSLMFPDIISLHLAKNNIITMQMPDTAIQFRNLKMIDLEGNNICDWEEVAKLGYLETLENLQLNNNVITSINIPSNNPHHKSKLFENLKELNINSNQIENWKSISELNKLANLKILHCINNPIIKNLKYLESWTQIVARISNLIILNRAEIPNNERRGAEYDLLKQHGSAWTNCKDDNQLKESFIDEFNSYPSLIIKYGLPEESLCNKPKSLKSKLLTVKLINSHDDRVLIKKLPIKMTVQSLLGLMQRLFDTGNDVPTLVYFNSQNPTVEIPLDNVTKNLDYFSIENDDVIMAKW